MLSLARHGAVVGQRGSMKLNLAQIVGLITGLLLSAITFTGCTGLLSRISAPPSPHLLLGKPSNATSFNANDYLIVRSQYALSYNRDKGIPNWASWQLNQSWLGDLPRVPFEPDPSLPQGWYHVQPSDYTGSGFDRGHLVPAADRDHTAADAKAAFLMTNILPQAPDNNQGPWEKLESYCRTLARNGKELYIIAGSVGEGGSGSKGAQTRIGRGQISVPKQVWKIVLVLNAPESPAPATAISTINEKTPVIAVVMPNQQGIKEQTWTPYRTSIDAIETMTGYDFLTNVPEPIQGVLEAKLK
jgi:endonuclease G, mitochondrial